MPFLSFAPLSSPLLSSSLPPPFLSCRPSAAILPHLDDVFVGVCNLIADVDTEVKNGTALFDRLLREIVTEAATESIRGADVAARVVPLLRGHMGVVNPYVRQLLVG